MAIKTLGKVFLGGVQFTTDPKIEPNWPIRQSVFAGLDLASTVQDFGRTAKDKTLTLTSDGNYVNASFKAAVENMIAVRGAVYDYSDYTGIVGTVKIISFAPKPTFIRDGSLILYEYTMVLKVMSLTKLDGATYTGS